MKLDEEKVKPMLSRIRKILKINKINEIESK